MTQPHQIDREAVARALFDRHWSAIPDAKPVWPGDDGGDYWFWLAGAVRPSAPEAVAWREKVRQRVAEIVEAAIERHVPTNSLRHTLDDADAILALISTHPVQGGEG